MLAQSTMLERAAEHARSRWKSRTVGVLLGGLSGEREISLKTGRGVAEALSSRGYRVVEVDAGRDLSAQLAGAGVDVAFVCLHGAFGEDGCVQGAMEWMGLPYTHSGVLASAMAMDKTVSKRLMEQAGLPTADWVGLRCGGRDDWSELAADVLVDLELPLVVKPATGGSSQGMSFVRDARDLPKAIEKAAASDGLVLVEETLRGKEYTVAVVDDGTEPQALPVILIEPKEGWFDYDNKYKRGRTRYTVPAPLDPELATQLQEMAITCHAAHGLGGVSRVDFILDEELGPQLIEVNSVPGMTATSLLPMASKELGVDYPTLCESILGWARTWSGGLL